MMKKSNIPALLRSVCALALALDVLVLSMGSSWHEHKGEDHPHAACAFCAWADTGASLAPPSPAVAVAFLGSDAAPHPVAPVVLPDVPCIHPSRAPPRLG